MSNFQANETVCRDKSYVNILQWNWLQLCVKSLSGSLC